MNRKIMITGANGGLGKDTARQLALIKETEKIYLACRSETKAIEAKGSLEKATGRAIFEIVLMDVSSIDSVKAAVASLDETIDALVMNAGGMGGKNPGRLTSAGVTEIFAANVLGHAVLVEELLKAGKLKKVALYASSEAVRGVKQLGMDQPLLATSSTEEFTSIFDGSFFGEKLDPMQAYGYVKYGATMWMASQARKHPEIRFISMSPGSTSGTAAMDSLPPPMKFMFKYVMMPIVMPLRGMAHKLEKGARRFVDGISDETLSSGVFYASKPNKLIGPVIDQSSIFPDLNNQTFQDNASEAVYSFIN
jgi:NAD(P)-dependent dehydrogenase (short-subunit alcohol dehydrogenase family)